MRIRTVIATSAVAIAAMAPGVPALAGSDARSAKQSDVVDTAVSAGRFKTLASLLNDTGLASTLKGKGPFTVFAPTDAAFAKVPKSTLAALAKDPEQLRAILLYHVAPGRLTAASVVKRSSIKTVNGQSLTVRVRAKRVFVGDARVTKPNVRTSNGVIHLIDRVLIPR
jgi:uncharacterized surface protein with fasciclin (FAS1) repeats